jgi:putative lipoprotein
VELPVPPAPPATGAETVTVTGVVTYRQRSALTPEAVVQVDLRDVTRPDTDEPPLVRQIIDKPGQVPIPFSLTCAKAAIEPGRSYAVSARITDRGQLQFVTDARVTVFSGALQGPIEIVVVPVR